MARASTARAGLCTDVGAGSAVRGMGRASRSQADAGRTRPTTGGGARSREALRGTISFPPRAKKGAWNGPAAAAPTSREMFPDVPKELMHDHDHGHGPHRHTHTHQQDDNDR